MAWGVIVILYSIVIAFVVILQPSQIRKSNLRWHGDFLFVVISIILKLSWGRELTLA